MYKDVFDHKTPYIYFINSFASLIPYNHIGLFIIEVIVLFVSIYYIYKTLKIIFSSSGYKHIDELAAVGAFIMASTFTIRRISFGYTRTETLAVAFLMIAIYIFTDFYYSVQPIERVKNKMFIAGILAGLSFMTNIKAIVLFVPFGIVTLFILIQNKNYKIILPTILYGFAGVVVSILPYLVYMIATNSFNDMVYAVFYTNLAYAKSNTPIVIETANGVLKYDPKDGFIAAIKMFTIMELPIMVLCYISMIIIFVSKYNKYLKTTTCAQVIIAFLYIMLSGRIHTYYLYILLPFFVSIYVFLVSIFVRVANKFNNVKINSYVLVGVVAILTFTLSFLNNNHYLKVLNYNYVNRANKMNEIVNNYSKNNNLKEPKVFAIGFRSEVYVYLDSKINYKYFILPSVAYSEDKTAYLMQYNYIKNVDPDIVVVTQYKGLEYFSKDMVNNITNALDLSYELIGEVTTNASEGSYYIFGKK